MSRTKLSSRIRIAFLNVMQAFGSAASQLASNAKLRVAEINLEARRHEILTEFSLQAFEMWHNGTKLPKELADMFVELSGIDDRLSILRAQKYARVKIESEAAVEAVEEAPDVEHEEKAPACKPAENTIPEEPKKAPTPDAPKKAPAAKAPAANTTRKRLTPVKKAARPKPKE